jgi:hypothetical protein
LEVFTKSVNDFIEEVAARVIVFAVCKLERGYIVVPTETESYRSNGLEN